MTSGLEEFREIYAGVAALVTEQAERRKVRRPPLRDPSVAHLSVLDVSRAALLAIEDDEAFVASCYLVLLETVPSPRQTGARLRWLREGSKSREDVLDQIVGSQAFARRERRVHFT